ncbi:AAA family ATPase [Vibrio astriarenae]|uniref:AAA family ATPase n=1 Tax=Vibrio astriarenae TaxID=1481923 RepID=A0A7Z2T4C8_9VIBR|nr:AAA family ATPase [Vibrio astriarenae]QIA64077.1 AAA family ATPase [Vibrio astriarenae]
MAQVMTEINFDSKQMPQIKAPRVPTTFEEIEVPRVVLDNLMLKQLAAYPKSDVLELTKLIGLNSHIVEEILAGLKRKSLIEVFQADGPSPMQKGLGHIRFGLSEAGSLEADEAFSKDAYLGPAPVSAEQYNKVVVSQDVRLNLISRDDITKALCDVSGSERLIDLLGPAVNSGRALLLYGEAGTGKTYVATRILDSLNSSVFVPYAVYTAGNIVKVLSHQHHKILDDGASSGSLIFEEQFDRRWALCHRPNIQVGGELTMDMLEVNHCDHSRVWMAPLQMMANNGVLIIDDLGRQAVSVDRLLNRWIVPMEHRFDQFVLPNGQQMSIPFILTLAFSTNLAPEDIGDPAFLRRLGYKIEFGPLTEADYLELWSMVCSDKGLDLPEDTLEHLLALHKQRGVSYYPCVPKDLAGISNDIVAFEQSENIVTPTVLSRAWEVYFTAGSKGGSTK